LKKDYSKNLMRGVEGEYDGVLGEGLKGSKSEAIASDSRIRELLSLNKSREQGVLA